MLGGIHLYLIGGYVVGGVKQKCSLIVESFRKVWKF